MLVRFPTIHTAVSIHPRLFRRGNSLLPAPSLPLYSCFNPPPPFQARERKNGRNAYRDIIVSIHPRLFRRGNDFRIVRTYTVLLFQSTPAFSGEGTTDAVVDVFAFWVSIHPRLFRRGNNPCAMTHAQNGSFNPPPPFQAREHRNTTMSRQL